jgi:haloacetate dehalogenase
LSNRPHIRQKLCACVGNQQGYDKLVGFNQSGFFTSQGHRLDAFDSRSLESYQEQIRDPARVHAMCEDYRAGAWIDRRLDLSDKTRGAKSKLGFPAATGDPLRLWKAWTQNLSGAEVDCGHFMPEENPDALLAAAVPFLNAPL